MGPAGAADRWLTFDCFGTLVDWRHGIRTTGELLFPGRGADFLDAYNGLEAEVELHRRGDVDDLRDSFRELVATTVSQAQSLPRYVPSDGSDSTKI